MEPGPLPPHERSWRHPSELGPTRFDVEDRAPSHVAAFAVGAVAVLAVAALVVAMTPRTSSSPLALNATTIAPSSGARPAQPAPAAVARTAGAGVPIGAILTSFAAYPHAVGAGPDLTIDGTDVADRAPVPGDVVLVRTNAVTYRLPWEQVPLLDAPDGTVVFSEDGEIVALVRHGDVVTLTDD